MPKHEPSSSRSKGVLSSDPRRPSEVRRYERPQYDPEQQPQDPLLLVGLLLGMLALILKMKFAAWLSLFCVAIAFANMRNDTTDLKQIVSSVTFALMGLVGSYIIPMPAEKRT